MLLPGHNTIPEQIAANKEPYYQALEAADEANRASLLDVSRLEKLMGEYQLSRLRIQQLPAGAHALPVERDVHVLP
jgi:hypothetical protein